MPKYIIKIKETICYSGHIEMNEEEYERLCLENKATQINKVRNKATITGRREEEELTDFYPLY